MVSRLRFLSECCQPVSTLQTSRQLSVDSCGLAPLAFFTSQEKRQSFAVAGPVTWNCLPAELRTLELFVPSCQAFEDLSLQQLLTAVHLLLSRI